MSTCQINLSYLYGIGQDFKIHFLTNEKVTSQHKDLISQHKDLTRGHKDLTRDGRGMPP